ncbi:erythromycin esterase family protein [Pseudoalteromonas sp. SSM20]|uniref:erythromycin esterase family protein n=1 Tax=Pseudoalteromonas sp. SSM20 TaxID=3139394 RepID=UPI003BAB1C36
MFKHITTLLIFVLSFAAHGQSIIALKKQACDKQVVYLGEEASHNNAKALTLRTEITHYLVENCGFNGVFFEAQTYDFVYLNKELEQGELNKLALEGALGGFVSGSQEVQPLVNLIYDKALSGSIYLAGLDMQTGGRTNQYTQQYLAKDIASLLGAEQSVACYRLINRHLNWLYDKQNPYSEKVKDNIAECAKRAFEASKTQTDSRLAYLAERYSTFNLFSRNNMFSLRSEGMYDSFVWHMQQLPQDSKVIVWGASIHGAKRFNLVNNKLSTLGKRLYQNYGNEYASYALVGLNKQQPSSELQVIVESLKKQEKALYLALGQSITPNKFAANIISYQQIINTEWFEQFDGILITERESPFTKRLGL